MTPMLLGPAGPTTNADLIAASLLTSDIGAELHLVARGGQRLRIAADEPTARALALSIWRALDRPDPVASPAS